MSGAEHTPVKLDEHKDVGKIKTMTQKVQFGGEDVKVDLPTYSKQHGEVFLRLVIDFWNMVTTYQLFNGAGNVVFDRFRRCLKPPARDDWDSLVTGINPTQNNLGRSFVAMFVRIFGRESPKKP